MKKGIYNLVLVAVFILCILAVSFIMAGVEKLFAIRIGQALLYVGFCVGIGIFRVLKPIIHKLFFKDNQ